MKDKRIIIGLLILSILCIPLTTHATSLWDMNDYIYVNTGIKEFHKAGYTGKNVNVGNYEKADYNHPHFNGKLVDVYGNRYEDREGSQHGNKTALIMHSVLPDSTIYLLGSSNVHEDLFLTQVAPLIKDKNILVTNGSKSFANNEIRSAVMKDLVDNHNHKSIISTGNFGEIGGFGGMEDMWKIGALNYAGVREGYSGYGDEYGFMTYCVYFIPNFVDELYQEGYPAIESGTSFSSPLFAGMVGLVDDFFIENTGQPLTSAEMKAFIADNTVELTDKYGMFVLPAPTSIDVDKYIVDRIGD